MTSDLSTPATAADAGAGATLQPVPVPATVAAPAELPSWKLAHPLTWRLFRCACGRPLYFRNSQCLHCGRALGYEPETGALVPLQEAGEAGENLWRIETDEAAAPAPASPSLYRRCDNLERAARCNWIFPAQDDAQGAGLCRCCRLNRMVPDLGVPAHALLWHRVELAKRRLVSSLISLGLPVASRLSEDTDRGLAFDLLVGAASPVPVMTGHRDGIITLNVEEADDATREAVRSAMQEPYRTVLGHLRHESGHYYWTRLLEGGAWLEPFRALFGDERADYAAALARHHAEGPPGDWSDRFISAYASAHPWEDWAETWAHYLHMLDALDTALGAGIDSGRVELVRDPFGPAALYLDAAPLAGADDQDFLAFVNAWVELTGMLNELSRSMGQTDFYPFIWSERVVTKLHFVHLFLRDQRPSADGASAANRVEAQPLPVETGTRAPEGVGESSVAGEEDPGAA